MEGMMITPTRLRWSGSFVCLLMPFFGESSALAGLTVTAAKSLTIQPGGPRGGEGGAEYLNIEGKANGRYASFGLLTFAAAKSETKPGRVEGITLTLVQSIPRFAKDGKVKFYLIKQAPTAPAELKFEPERAGGVTEALDARCALGGGEFKKIETGHADTFGLSLDEAGQALVQKQLESGGEIWLLIVPDDDAVAATYFGAEAEEADRRPRVTFKIAGP
jgi:hypothetical protein